MGLDGLGLISWLKRRSSESEFQATSFYYVHDPVDQEWVLERPGSLKMY
jgi:hypothetical protein